LPGFYEKHGGYVLAMAIDKYMHVILNVPIADRLVRLHYSKSEVVSRVAHLNHPLAREALLMHGIHDAIEVASVADLPSGTGLGSSSCYLVGLLNAIRAYLARPAAPEEVAEEACRIELQILKQPIGKQDQYMAVYGGLTELEIGKDGSVDVRPLTVPTYSLSDFVSKTHLYYTNIQRNTTDILSEQTAALRAADRSGVEDRLLRIRDIGYEIGAAMKESNFDRFGELMHAHWLAKRELSSRVTVPAIEQLYDYLRAEYGVLGGKVAGAGGGGFLMLYCPHKGEKLMQFMKSQGSDRLGYFPEFDGSRVILNARNSHTVHHHKSQPSTQVRVSTDHD